MWKRKIFYFVLRQPRELEKLITCNVKFNRHLQLRIDLIYSSSFLISFPRFNELGSSIRWKNLYLFLTFWTATFYFCLPRICSFFCFGKRVSVPPETMLTLKAKFFCFAVFFVFFVVFCFYNDFFIAVNIKINGIARESTGELNENEIASRSFVRQSGKLLLVKIE